MAQCEQAVCRVEYGELDPQGTGFLVGPDLLVTNHHVCEAIWRGQRPAQDVQFRFGYRKLANGQEQKGMTVKLAAKDWLIDHSPDDNARGMNFVLVRLSKAVGEEKTNASKNAFRRGWLTPVGYNFDGGEMVFVIQHSKGLPLQFASGTANQPNEHLITYRANTLPGSSGAPVFLKDWSLVALHHRAHDTEAYECIAFASILKLHPKVTETVAGVEALDV